MPPSLGQKLRQAREDQGLSLADVSHKTRIPAARLQDLEGDNYNTFGSLTYARSFLQSYANLLGVDARGVTDQLRSTPLGGPRNYRYLTTSLGRWISREKEHSVIPEARPIRSSKIGVALAAVVCAVLAGGVLWAKALLTERKPPPVDVYTALPRAGSKERPVHREEIRSAQPARYATENVPIRRALPVDDNPKSWAKK